MEEKNMSNTPDQNKKCCIEDDITKLCKPTDRKERIQKYIDLKEKCSICNIFISSISVIIISAILIYFNSFIYTLEKEIAIWLITTNFIAITIWFLFVLIAISSNQKQKMQFILDCIELDLKEEKQKLDCYSDIKKEKQKLDCCSDIKKEKKKMDCCSDIKK